MPRGTRKSPKEKLQQKLYDVTEAINQYEEAVKTLKEQKSELEEEMAQMELREVLDLMKEKNLTTEDVKEIIDEYQPQVEALEQGA